MADKKISEMTAASAYTGANEFYEIVQGGNTRQGSHDLLKDYLDTLYLPFSAATPVAWTPTFTGFGSVSNINAYSWRVGSELFYEIYFTSGTPTGVEARVSLGFNGVNGSVTTSSTYAALQMVGFGGGSNSAVGIYCLAEASQTYLTFGRLQATSTFPLSKNLGTDFVVASGNYSLKGSVRIQGW